MFFSNKVKSALESEPDDKSKDAESVTGQLFTYSPTYIFTLKLH